MAKRFYKSSDMGIASGQAIGYFCSMLRKIALVLFAGLPLLFAACEDVDKTDPVVVVTEPDYKVPLGGTYVEKGAQATDREDGVLDAANILIDAANVRTDSVGDYEVFYSITDAAGNDDIAIRTLGVFASYTDFAGTYSVSEACSDSTFLSYTATVSNDTDTTVLKVSNIHDLGAGEEISVGLAGRLGTFLNTNDTLPTFVYSGQGELTVGTTANFEFKLVYDQIDTTGVLNCEATFTKQ